MLGKVKVILVMSGQVSSRSGQIMSRSGQDGSEQIMPDQHMSSTVNVSTSSG